MATILMTDSSADFELTELAEKNILCVPLAVNFGEESFLDGVELSKSAFYEKLLAREQFPFTSQPAPEAFLQHFLAAKERGDSVVAVLLSGGLSGTMQSATIAKEMAAYEEIYIVDSRLAVTGLRLLLDTAAKLRAQNVSAVEIAAQMEALKKRITIVAVVDTLEYLHRGGRLTKTQARIGEMVNLKPILSLNPEGKIFVMDKALGASRARKTLLKHAAGLGADPAYPVLLAYTHDPDNALKLGELAKAHFPTLQETPYDIGPTIGTHLGDKAYAITLVRK